MMRDPVSLRNIPKEVLRLARAIQQKTGMSMSDVFRLALVSGTLIEASRLAPDPDGSLCGLDPADLARQLRRPLGSAIDLLLEHGQHPYQGSLSGRSGAPVQLPSTATVSGSTTPAKNTAPMHSIADDLEALGMGLGFSEALQDRELSR